MAVLAVLMIFSCAKNNAVSPVEPVNTATVTVTQSHENTVTMTATPTLTPSVTETDTPENTATQTFTSSPTFTISDTHTVTSTFSNTPTATPTATITLTHTPEPLSAWTRETDAADFGYQSAYEAVVYAGNIWLIGRNGDVWSSAGGVDWALATGNAGYPLRGSVAAVVHDSGDGEKMWVIGSVSDGNTASDIWRSTNGQDWEIVTLNAQFADRDYHDAVSFNGKIYVYGGYRDSVYYSDVWSSTDGINWVQEEQYNYYGNRAFFRAFVHGGKVWIIGGYSSIMGYSSDVMSSVDGINFNPVFSPAKFVPRRHHAAFSHDGRIWVIGGQTGTNAYDSQVWYSAAGDTWVKTCDNIFSPTYSSHGVIYHAAVSFDTGTGSRAWIIGGSHYLSYGTPLGAYPDVWSSY